MDATQDDGVDAHHRDRASSLLLRDQHEPNELNDGVNRPDTNCCFDGIKEPLKKTVSYSSEMGNPLDEHQVGRPVCLLSKPDNIPCTTVTIPDNMGNVPSCSSRKAIIKLCVVVLMTLLLWIGLMVAAHLTHSLTLRVEAYHSLYNLITLAGSLLSIKLCREPESLHNTFGWARIDVVSFLCSLIFLSALCFSVTVEAVQTAAHVGHQDAMHYALAAILVCTAALAVNALVFGLIGGYTQHQGSYLELRGSGEVFVRKQVAQDSLQKGLRTLSSRNLKSNATCPQTNTLRQGFKDIMRDISGLLLTMAVAAIVLTGEEEGQLARYIDPAIAVVSVLILMWLSYPFGRECMNILLQTIPGHIDVESFKERLQESFPAIINVHHFHIWSLTPGKVVSTIHVVFASPEVYQRISASLIQFFAEEDISSVTLQPEFSKPNQTYNTGKCCCTDHFLDDTADSCDDLFCTERNIKKLSALSLHHLHCSQEESDEREAIFIKNQDTGSGATPDTHKYNDACQSCKATSNGVPKYDICLNTSTPDETNTTKNVQDETTDNTQDAPNVINSVTLLSYKMFTEDSEFVEQKSDLNSYSECRDSVCIGKTEESGHVDLEKKSNMESCSSIQVLEQQLLTETEKREECVTNRPAIHPVTQEGENLVPKTLDSVEFGAEESLSVPRIEA